MGLEPKLSVTISSNNQDSGNKQPIEITIHGLLIRINISKNAAGPCRYIKMPLVQHNH
jgi:hypothetical protein